MVQQISAKFWQAEARTKETKQFIQGGSGPLRGNQNPGGLQLQPEDTTRQIMDLATCQFIERKERALFIGPVGVGKSHLIQALIHEACRLGYRVLYTRISRLLADLRGGHADGTWESPAAS